MKDPRSIPTFCKPSASLEDVRAAISQHPLKDEHDADYFKIRCKGHLPELLHAAADRCIDLLLEREELAVPVKIFVDTEEDREEALASIGRLRAEKALDRIEYLFRLIGKSIPADKEGTVISHTPLIGMMRDHKDVVHQIVYELSQAKTDALVFKHFAPIAIGASNVGDRTFINPKQSNLSGLALASHYLKRTPFFDLLSAPMPVVLPNDQRYAHVYMIAPPKWGKTQTLQHLIYQDLVSEKPPALIVIEPKGDMVRNIAMLKAAQKDLVIIDPALEPPMNPFALKADDPDAEAELIEQYSYIFSALDSEIAKGQKTALAFVAKFVIRQKQDLMYFLDVLNDEPPKTGKVSDKTQSVFYNDMMKMDRIAADFFENQFFQGTFSVSRKALAGKIRYLLSRSHRFDKMFTAKENLFDMSERFRPGAVTLINTSKDHLLPKDASSMLGRWFIAQVRLAAHKRASVREHLRTPVFLVIDEAGEYFDESIEEILTQTRSMHVGICFAHQGLNQLSNSLKSSALGRTYVKIIAPDDEDAPEVARSSRTTVDAIRALRSDDKRTEWMLCVRGQTPTPISFPILTAEKADKIGEKEYETLRNRFRRKPAEVEQEKAEEPPSGPEKNGGDDYESASFFE